MFNNTINYDTMQREWNHSSLWLLQVIASLFLLFFIWVCKRLRFWTQEQETLIAPPSFFLSTFSQLISWSFYLFTLFFLYKINKLKDFMGHACSKVVNTTHLTSVDHGSLVPQGIYTTDNDYDINIVRHLIRKGQLAPFYTGKLILLLDTIWYVHL